jgi:hypothetical protein
VFDQFWPSTPASERIVCNLCGALWTEEHWAEVEADQRTEAPDGTVAFEVHAERRGQRLRDRARRAQLVSAVFAGYGLQFQDWEGSSYILRDAKGNSAVAPDLASLLPAAEQMLGGPLDPLAPAFLDRIRARAARDESGSTHGDQ